MENNLRIKLKLERDKKSRNHTYESIVESIKKREEDYRMYVAPQAQLSDLHFYIFDINEFCSNNYNNIIFNLLLNREYERLYIIRNDERIYLHPIYF
jgi:phosphoribulokinase